MPRYEANPANDQAIGLTIVPNGEYELKVKRVGSFERTNQEGKESYGVRLTVQACEGEFAGKTLSPVTLYYHSEGGRGYSKTQLIAIAGFASEAEFNDWARDLDFGFNTEDKSVNDGWNQLVGKRFIAEIKLGLDNNDKPRNEYGQLRAL